MRGDNNYRPPVPVRSVRRRRRRAGASVTPAAPVSAVTHRRRAGGHDDPARFGFCEKCRTRINRSDARARSRGPKKLRAQTRTGIIIIIICILAKRV